MLAEPDPTAAARRAPDRSSRSAVCSHLLRAGAAALVVGYAVGAASLSSAGSTEPAFLVSGLLAAGGAGAAWFCHYIGRPRLARSGALVTAVAAVAQLVIYLRSLEPLGVAGAWLIAVGLIPVAAFSSATFLAPVAPAAASDETARSVSWLAVALLAAAGWLVFFLQLPTESSHNGLGLTGAPCLVLLGTAFGPASATWSRTRPPTLGFLLALLIWVGATLPTAVGQILLTAATHQPVKNPLITCAGLLVLVVVTGALVTRAHRGATGAERGSDGAP
jgi:hypothetical protein